jgi:hypothetical protein
MFAWADALNDIQLELEHSVKLHPRYPDDEIRRAAITAEEAGEVLKAALDLTRLDTPTAEAAEHLYNECCQCAAMAIKHMLALRGVDVDGYFRLPEVLRGKR